MKNYFVVSVGFSDTGFAETEVRIDASDILYVRPILTYLVQSHFAGYEDVHPKTRYIRLAGATGQITWNMAGVGNMPNPADVELPNPFSRINWEELLSANS